MEGYDDVETLTCEFKTSITIQDEKLNYLLLDDNEDEGDNSKNCHENFSDMNPIGITSDTIPIPSKFQHQRRNLAIANSYEVGIRKSYVNKSSGIKTTYKPKLMDFEPIKVLGKGSFGKVLLVREIATGKLFAQKQLKKATFIINENTNEINEINYKRTLNEKTILETVNHPNIVKLYYAFQDNNKVYLILEYLDGGELFHHLAQERFMTEKNASYYIAQIILALRYLHCNLKVIYRDLKPENCMLNNQGNLVLTDFGLSKEVNNNEKKNHSMTGTAQYMAPEVIKGEPYDYSVDWWSLGCVAYDLLVGQPPFTGNNSKKIMDKILASTKKSLKFPFYLSNDAKDLLRKLLQVDPEKRLNIDEDFTKLKNHPFFRHINWKELETNSSNLLPPILPIITDPILAENFDNDFTDMPFTPQTHNNYLGKDIFHVKGFSYTNESYLNSRS